MQRKLTIDELKKAVEDLLGWEALEICCYPERKEVLLPYCMNDGLEDYIGFSGCRIMGSAEPHMRIVSVDYVEVESGIEDEAKNGGTRRGGIIFRQKNGQVVTVWYEDIFRSTSCFQYHRIGHGWRKTAGEEYLRRLVNILCVLHDKCNFLGEAFCSKEELQLAKLAEFAPILYYTPINESIQDWYPESLEGIMAFADLLMELSGEIDLSDKLEEYSGAFAQEMKREMQWEMQRETQRETQREMHGEVGRENGQKKSNSLLNLLTNMNSLASQKRAQKAREERIKNFADLLLEKENVCIWRRIAEKIASASEGLEIRDYGAEENRHIEEFREKVAERYQADGWSGIYPYMTKAESEIFFVEEHPFTVMEAEGFEFKIFSIQVDDGDFRKEEFRREEMSTVQF